MIKIDTTQNLISNHRTATPYVAGDIIETEGYTTKGDGGGARWVATGGLLTPSRDPLALGSARLSTFTGNEFVLVNKGVIDLNALGGTSASYIAIAEAGGYIYAQGLSSGGGAGSVFKETIIATPGQTVFNTAENYALGANNLNVYLNGVRQDGTSYTETSISSFTLAVPASGGDEVEYIIGEVSGFVPSGVSNIATVSELENLVGVVTGQSFMVRERANGVFTSVLTSGVTPNGFGIIQSTVNPLISFVLDENGVVNSGHYGVKGDGVTDDALALIASVDSGSASYVEPNKTYYVGSAVAGVFWSDGPTTIIGGGSITIKDILSDNALFNPAGPRNSVNYESAQAVQIRGKAFAMGGFRMYGQYYKDTAPTITTNSLTHTVNIESSLGFGMSSGVPGWYAIFACMDEGDSSPTFRAIPFLAVGSVSSNIVTLNSTLENSTTVAPITYTWSDNALNGLECLVIHETLSGRPNAFSGRVATITDSTTTTITLDNAGGLALTDFILPAPNGFDHYRYCCSFLYEDSGGGVGEVRNIADSGSEVKAKMVNNAAAPIGSQVASIRIGFNTLISPLATAVIAKETSSFSTATIGQYASTYDSDASNHPVATTFDTKETAATYTTVSDGMLIPFSFAPETYYKNFGGLAPLRSGGTLEVQGWVEV